MHESDLVLVMIIPITVDWTLGLQSPYSRIGFLILSIFASRNRVSLSIGVFSYASNRNDGVFLPLTSNI